MIRRRTQELMDAPDVDPAEHVHALRALNRVNHSLGVNAALARAIDTVIKTRPASVLDLGCGGGGFLAFLRQRPGDRAPGLLIGVDRSAQALGFAWQQHGTQYRGVVADACSLPFADASIDVVTCSLFLHHFDPDGAVQVLQEAARVARQGVVVGDLSRSRLAWWATWLGTRLLSRSRLFHVDGPKSVRAAYTVPEIRHISEQAGLAGARIRPRFPFRLLLTWTKRMPGR